MKSCLVCARWSLYWWIDIALCGKQHGLSSTFFLGKTRWIFFPHQDSAIAAWFCTKIPYFTGTVHVIMDSDIYFHDLFHHTIPPAPSLVNLMTTSSANKSMVTMNSSMNPIVGWVHFWIAALRGLYVFHKDTTWWIVCIWKAHIFTRQWHVPCFRWA